MLKCRHLKTRIGLTTPMDNPMNTGTLILASSVCLPRQSLAVR